MNIINMSLGNGSAFRSNPIAVLADKLTAQGVIVVASAGNSGADVSGPLFAIQAQTLLLTNNVITHRPFIRPLFYGI
jgi:subtilisin family serine protease